MEFAPPAAAPEFGSASDRSPVHAPAPSPHAPPTSARPLDAAGSAAAFAHLCEADGDSVCVARQLEVSTDQLKFPKTRVGARSTSSVVITNTDPTQVIDLSGVALTDHGLGDFEVHGKSGMLKPSESITIAVSYAPTAEGSHHASVRFFAPSGATTPSIALRGAAVEDDAARASRIELQEHEIENSTASEHPTERRRATSAVDDWRDSQDQLADAIALWSSLNWTQFLSETGGDFRVAWTEGHVSNLVGDALSMIAGAISSNPVIEFVASTVTSVLYDAISTVQGNREGEETVYQEVKKTGAKIGAKQLQLASAATRNKQHIRGLATTAKQRIATASDLADITHVAKWARSQSAAKPTPIVSDRSLYRALLESWVLERSATAREATEVTNRPAYAAAKKTLMKREPGEDLRRADLFVHQIRNEFSLLGIAGIAEIEAPLAGKCAALIAQAYASSLDGAGVASYVANMMGELTFDLRVPYPEVTHRALAAAGITVDARDFKSHRLHCKASLAADGESVSATFFHYYLGSYVGAHRP